MDGSKRQVGRWIVHVNHAAGLERHADWLLSYFEKMHRDGVPFSHGTKIKLGWSILELQNQEGNALVVHEPDFSKNPLVDICPDASVTLQVQASQVALVNQLGLSPCEVTFQDKFIFAKGSMDARKIYLERVPPRPDKGDSGWFVGFVDGNNGPANLQSGLVYQLLYLRPMLLQFLLMPAGYMVVLDGNQIEAILDREGKPIASN